MKKLITFLLLFSALSANASHIAGGFLSYAPSGNINEYEFTLTVYEDCGGAISMGPSTNISLVNSCGFFSMNNILLTSSSSEEISQICTNQLANTTCNGGSLFGMKKLVYTGTYVLPGNCSNWTLSYRSCNRNSSVNINPNECFYIETTFNNIDFSCNSSPIVTGLYQVPYTCVGQTTNLSSYIIDLERDSLSFTFISALSDSGFTVPYNTSFSGSAPIPGITLSSTGELSFNYTVTGSYVIAILVEEFDDQGQLKSAMIHDFQIIIENCANQMPIINNSFGFNNFGTNATISGDTIVAGLNDQFCLDLTFSDPDPNTVLQLSTDIQTILPGATTSSITTGNSTIMTVCWTYDPNFIGGFFSVKVTDDACPIPGIASKTFYLDFPASLVGLPDTMVICSSNSAIQFSSCVSSTQNLEWRDGNGNLLAVGTDVSCNPCANPDILLNNDTTIFVNHGAHPTISKPVVINYFDDLVSALPDSVYSCEGELLTFNGIHPNLAEQWQLFGQGPVNQNQISFHATDTTLLTYMAEASPECILFGSTEIIVLKPVVSAINNSVNLLASQHTAYQWLLNNSPISGATNQSHFPVNNGDYSVIGFDQWNCSDTSNIVTITTAGIEHHNSGVKIIRQLNNITISGLNNHGEILIFDLQGKLISKQWVTQSTENIKLRAENQLYIVKVISEDNQLITTRKL